MDLAAAQSRRCCCCVAPGRHQPTAIAPQQASQRHSADSRSHVQQQQGQPHRTRPMCATSLDATWPFAPPTAAGPITSTVQELKAASRDPAAFAAVLQRLAERGSGDGATEAHVVAAWAAQSRSPALRPVPGSHREADVLRGLVALEELTRRQLVALTPDQLGFVFRCYVLAGGSSKPLLQGLQHAAASWRAEEYSAAGIAELAWALASSSAPVSDACLQLLRGALQGGQGGSGAEQEQQQEQQAEQPADRSQEQQQAQPPIPVQQRDWAAWFEGTPAGKVSLVTLLWALATLRADDQLSLVRMVTQQLGDRIEARMGVVAGKAHPVPPSDWAFGGVDDSTGSMLGNGPEDCGKEEAEALLGGAAAAEFAAAGHDLASSSRDAWHSDAAPGTSSGSSDNKGDGLPRSQLLAAPVGQGEDLHAGMLSTAVWACGQLRHADGRMLRGAATLLQDQVSKMSPGDVGRLLWSLAQLGQFQPHLLAAVVEHLQAPGVLSAFNVRQLAMTTHAFVALDFFPGQCCVDLIADACLAARDGFGADPRSLSNVLWTMSRLGYVDELFYLAFVPVILPSIQQYGPSELADVARVYSRSGLNPKDERAVGEGAGGSLFDALARQTMACIQGAELQDVLRIMTAFHQMGLQPEELLAAVEGWANRRLRALSPQALSLALWSFARMGSRSPKLLETAAACAEQQLGTFTPTQMAKVAWSLAKLHWPAPRVLCHAGAQLAARTAAFTDKQASNVLWALASEGKQLSAQDLDSIATALQPRLMSFSAQSLATIAWAYATMAHAPPPLFLHLLGNASLQCLSTFDPQGLSMLVWSLASLGCRHDALFGEIVGLCCEHPSLMRQFEGQHLSNLLWGLCRMGFQPVAPFLDDIGREAEMRVCDLKPQELFNIAWSYSQLRYHPESLFDAIALEAAPRAFSFTPQELSGTLWALAKAGHATRSTHALLDAVEGEVLVRGASFEPRHLAVVSWSAGQLGWVMRPAALEALLCTLRPEELEGLTLATLVDGLATMERQRQRQQQQARPAAARPASMWQGSSVAALLLVPPQMVAAMVERTAQLLPHLQHFEYAQLMHGFSVLGSPQARRLFLQAPDAAAAEALVAAVRHATAPAVVGLLAAMVRWNRFPSPAFPLLVQRLRRTSPQYRLSQSALVVLGEALGSMPPRELASLALRSGLQKAALAAAAAAAQRAAAGASTDGDSGIGSDSDEGPVTRGSSRWSGGHSDSMYRAAAATAAGGCGGGSSGRRQQRGVESSCWQPHAGAGVQQ